VKSDDGESETGTTEAPRDLRERLLDYAVRIVRVVESLPKTLTGRRIADELLRSGTCVGAHYEEARGAESKLDFVHKLQVGLKELRESNYWLRLASRARLLPPRRLTEIIDESNQLQAILSKAVATAKGSAKENRGSAIGTREERAEETDSPKNSNKRRNSMSTDRTFDL